MLITNKKYRIFGGELLSLTHTVQYMTLHPDSILLNYILLRHPSWDFWRCSLCDILGRFPQHYYFFI